MYKKLKMDKQLFEETENSAVSILEMINDIDTGAPVVKDAYVPVSDIVRREYELLDDLIDETIWTGVKDYYDLYDKIQSLPFIVDLRNTNEKRIKLFKKTQIMANPSYNLAYNKKAVSAYNGKLSDIFVKMTETTINAINKFWNDNDPSLIQYFSHYISFTKLYGPMSFYSPEGMFSTVSGYFRQENINVEPEYAEMLAHIIVAVARNYYDILAHIETKDIDDTAQQMRSRNPIAAYSLPTLGTARSDEDYQMNLAIAKRVAANPLSSPLVFFLQTRLTSKGNDFLTYLQSKGYMDENGIITKKLTPQLARAFVEEASNGGQDKFIYFVPGEIRNADGAVIGNKLSADKRQDLIINEPGFEFLSEIGKDGNYKYTHYIEDSHIYVRDDASLAASKSPYKAKTKIRTVYAGSGHWALIGATYLYAIQDDLMQRTAANNYGVNLRANWSKPLVLRNAIENMFEAIENRPDMFSHISADDKSGFDNYVPPHLTIPFYAYILANKFNAVEGSLKAQQLAQLGAATRLAPLWTPWGLLAVPHAVPSGMSFTNLVDSFCSLILGLYSNIKFLYTHESECRALIDEFISDAEHDDLFNQQRMRSLNIKNKYRLVYAYLHYLMKRNIEPVVNGDDYSGLWIRGMSMSDIANTYSELGFIVHPTKGLVSPDVTEFSARVFYKGAYVQTETQINEDDDTYHSTAVVSNGIPFPRSFYKDVYKEDEPTKSEMIEDLGILDRITNHQEELLSPNMFIDIHESVSYSTLGESKYEYIKLQDMNTETKQITIINDPYDVVLAAGDDANYLKTSLAVIRDRTWDPAYSELQDGSDAFSKRRSIKYIRARRDGKGEAIRRLDEAIDFQGTSKSADKHESGTPAHGDSGYNSLYSTEGTEKGRTIGVQSQVKVDTANLKILELALRKRLNNESGNREPNILSLKYPNGRVRIAKFDKVKAAYIECGLEQLLQSFDVTTTKKSFWFLHDIACICKDKEWADVLRDIPIEVILHLMWKHYTN